MSEGEDLRFELQTRPNGGSKGGEKRDDDCGHVAADRISLGAQLQWVQRVRSFRYAQGPYGAKLSWRPDRELFGDHDVSAETYARAVRVFGERDLVDVVGLMGAHAADAAGLAAFDQHLPEERQPL